VQGYTRDKEELRRRLRRISGQVGGIEKMIDEDRYCIDVLTQVSAVKAALESVALLLLEDHVDHCVADAIRAGDGTGKVRELSAAIERFVKS
jgi:CsoR family transcriptional regulator, copper-sensing transcriptional repressor